MIEGLTGNPVIPQKTYSDLLNEAIAREKRTGIEFCVSCTHEVNFSSSVHVDDPIRTQGGAYYQDCSGQVCAGCANKEKAPTGEY